MKIEFHVNGAREVWLTASDEEEAKHLERMSDAAQKGQKLKITRRADGTVIISVEK